MSSYRFPDVNVWLALAAPEHVHALIARQWWDSEDRPIAFSRFTQLGLLRLVTTAAAMGNRRLSLSEAWRVYDRFFSDDRVTFVHEPPSAEMSFREFAKSRTASPKILADAWLLAVARAAGGQLITFDRVLESRGAHCLLSGRH